MTIGQYKNPESILVVIYCAEDRQVLMLQRNDDAEFWQSVTGSIESGETPFQAAIREVKEETGIDIVADKLPLVDCHQSVVFEIFPQFRHRYAPEVTHNREHWFTLALPSKPTIELTEHLSYQWLAPEQAAELTKSWNNRDAIQAFLI